MPIAGRQPFVLFASQSVLLLPPMIAFMILFGLALLYFWLRGWWFAGLLVFLAYWLGGTQAWGHSWLVAAAIGFAPWFIRYAIRDTRRIAAERTIKRTTRPDQLRPGEPVPRLLLPHHDAGR